MKIPERFSVLFATTCLTSLAMTPAALAQSTDTAAAGSQSAAAEVLGEIVVTANRQSESINSVPLSISAVTQKSLDQLGVRNVQDIARTIPSLSIGRSDNNSLQPSIRGIIASGGAPTTGIYIDDTPLQKRSGIGAIVGNGSPFPPIFDLQRIEVLRGPQGTLYGGSSQGGTIRFIQAEPSLDKLSIYGRAQLSTTETGSPSYEAGIAIGGPLIEDVLGIRASIYRQHQGGYVDHYDQYTGLKELDDSNMQNTTSGRVALTWVPSPGVKITPAVYAYLDKLDDASASWLDVPQSTTPARYFTSTGAATTAGAANVAYTYPAQTYGPYDFYGPNRSGVGRKSPAKSWLVLPSLMIDVELGDVTAKSITSYVRDGSKGLAVQAPSNSAAVLQAGMPFVAQLPDFAELFYYRNVRDGWTQEVRFSSPEGQRLSWVMGLFYSKFDTHSYNNTVANLDALTQLLRGVSTQVVYGVPLLPGNTAQIRDQRIGEDSLAVFGQLNFALTDRLKATAGVRVSREKLTYEQAVSGPFSGYTIPTTANGGLARGSVKSTPISPKFGLEYEFDARNLIYANAAKGFRAGGVNLPLPNTCAPQLAAAGLTSTPETYDPDTLWAFEAGAKLRVGNRAQINTSVFWNNWKDIQFNVLLPGCVFNYTSNAGKAVSRGADIQATVNLTDRLTATVSASYTDAQYKGDIRGPAPAGALGTLFVTDGDKLPTPPWSVQLGGQYTVPLSEGVNGYIRADMQFQSKYTNGFGPATNTYRPDTYRIPSTTFVSARAGVNIDELEVSLFVNNLLNSKDVLAYVGPPAGRYGCLNTECSSFRLYSPLLRGVFSRPREIGLTATYRY